MPVTMMSPLLGASVDASSSRCGSVLSCTAVGVVCANSVPGRAMLATGNSIADYRVTRLQFRRDRKVGDSQVGATQANIVALGLIDEAGRVGLGFVQVLFQPLLPEATIAWAFEQEVFPMLEGQEAGALALRVGRSRGGNVRRMLVPFEEAIQHAVWDLFAQSSGLPLWKLLGAQRVSVPVYASGLDFHLSDHDFTELFGRAAQAGYWGYKIKVGHSEIERDLHRLDLLKRRPGMTGGR